MKSFTNRSSWRGHSLALKVALVAISGATLAGASVLGVAAAAAKSKTKPLIVWIDTARVSYEQAYMKAHPGANVKWVIYNGNSNGTGVLQSKFGLWNRTGWPSNAPDVMFDTQNYDAVQLGTAPYNGLLDLKQYVPSKVLKNFATGSAAACTTPKGAMVCLRNDSAADVLWVNKGLFNQFFPGQTPPTTWQGIVTDGQSLQSSHPGYLVGDIGDQFDEDFILWGNECPLNQVTAEQTVTINPSSSNCTTIANMLAPVEGKSFTTTGVFSSGFKASQVVMMVGPLWYGTAVFENGSTTTGVPNGTMVAYPPPAATNGAHVTGALGGGLWLVSAHTKQPAAAAALAEYMATSPKVQKPGVDAGLPQYVPDETSYLSSLSSLFADASVTEASWKTAASEVWTGWSPVPWSTDAVWGSTALANLTGSPPAPFAAQLLPYAEALANQARLAGYTVKSPVSAVSHP
jgi:ABC-type glycerol-3-phosphate transport system substrate-binding protein